MSSPGSLSLGNGNGKNPERRSPRGPQPEDDRRAESEEKWLANLEADTRLKQGQARALDDEHDLQSLKLRQHKLNIEITEIKRGLMLLGVVLLGAYLVAAIVLAVLNPSAPGHQLIPFPGVWKFLLG